MKKKLLNSMRVSLVAALLGVGVSNAWADVIETVGATDFTSAFNVPRSSSDFSITGNGGKHITFVNHNNSGANYNNWCLCINDGSSTEYMFLRADNYGWDANLYNYYSYGAGLDWNTFVSDLNGATVEMYIYRKGTNVFVRNTITTSSSETYYYDACGYNITAETIHPYLTVDHSYLEITGNEAIAEDGMPTLPDYPTIGNCTTQVWTEAIRPITMSKGNAYYFKFTNTMIGTNSWENYKFRGVQVVDATDVERFNIRADNWDDKNGSNVSFSSNFDWTNFKDDLNGATVEAVFAYNSDGTVFFRTEATPSTEGRTTVRYEQYTYADTYFTDADIKLYPAVNGAYIEMMSQSAAYKVEVAANNVSYGTAAITSGAIGGYVGSGNSVTVTATPEDGYVFNGWKSGEEYVSRNSTYAFTVTANTTLQAEFVAIKTSWNFKTASWEKSNGIDYSKTATINGATCYFANGDLAGLVLDNSGSSGTNWTVNSNGLTQGNGSRNIGILNCTAGQLVTIQTNTTLSAPVNGTLIGTATTGTVYYQVTADGTFGFKEERNNYITSIAVTDMDYTILYAANKAVYDTKVASLDAAGQAYWATNVTAASAVTTESEYNTASASLPTVYMTAVKAQTTPNSDMTGAVENANCETVVDWGTVTAWSSTSSEFHGNTHSTDVAQITTPFAEAWVWTGGENSAAVLADQSISHTAISGLAAGTYRVTGFIRAASEGSHATETPTGFTLYANSETSSTTEGITFSAGLVYGTYSVDVTLDGSEDLTLGIKIKDANFNWIAFKNFTLTLVSLAHVAGTIASSGYSSLASAYGLDFSNATGLTAAYVVTNITKDAVTLTSVDELPANSGVILKGTGGDAYSIPVKADASYDGTNKLYAAVTAYDCAANKVYILQSGEFHLVTAASTVPAGKAYLKAEDVPNEARSLSFLFGDEETGISAVSRDMKNGEFYNLQGQRVDAPKKGLYIVNGTKVIIK